MLDIAEIIKTWLLSSYQVTVPEEWLAACIEWIQHEHQNSNLSAVDLQPMVFEQWLLSDLRELGSACLPQGLHDCMVTSIAGPFTLQVNSMLDVGSSHYSKMLKVKGVINDNIEVSAEKQFAPKACRMLLLTMSDGSTDVRGMEYQPIPSLSCALQPGFKVILHGTITCRRGILLLTANNVQVLGGEVDVLAESNPPLAVLQQAMEKNSSICKKCERKEFSGNFIQRKGFKSAQYNENHDIEISNKLSLLEPKCKKVDGSEKIGQIPNDEWEDDIYYGVELNCLDGSTDVENRSAASRNISLACGVPQPEIGPVSSHRVNRVIPTSSDTSNFSSRFNTPLDTTTGMALASVGTTFNRETTLDDVGKPLSITSQCSDNTMSIVNMLQMPLTESRDMSPVIPVQDGQSIDVSRHFIHHPVRNMSDSCRPARKQRKLTSMFSPTSDVNHFTGKAAGMVTDCLTERRSQSSCELRRFDEETIEIADSPEHTSSVTDGSDQRVSLPASGPPVERVLCADAGSSGPSLCQDDLDVERRDLGLVTAQGDQDAGGEVTTIQDVQKGMIGVVDVPVLFIVKGYLLTLTDRLRSGSGDVWSLSCRITDGTGCLDVSISDSVLTELIGFSAKQSMTLRQQARSDARVKDYLTKQLQICQQSLIDFLGRIDLRLEAENNENKNMDRDTPAKFFTTITIGSKSVPTPNELLYADNLVLMDETIEVLRNKCIKCKHDFENKA